ncbi:MAG: preprotein translocase subunit SecG [Clostridia bacterium]|nr:preprotein translocase subunit SecG [Clostridia bacterium]
MNTALNITLGIILLLAAIFLIVAVLMQSGKSHKLSGTIAGGAETFFGKTKGKSIDKLFSRLTTIVSIAFVVLVLVVYVFQDKPIEDAKDDALDDAISDSEITEETDK